MGDVLFFFVSGFTLFLRPMQRFDNWYKRRINRIYPTVFAYAIIGAFILNHNTPMDKTILYGGSWFVTCIMLYYIVIYFIRKYLLKHLSRVFGIILTGLITWYYMTELPPDFNMYGHTYYKWFSYFIFMLMGAMLGLHQNSSPKSCFKYNMLKLLCSSICFYALYIIGKSSSGIPALQVWTLIPLLFFVYYTYQVCASNILRKVYENKVWGSCIRFIGGLCLEIYLVQPILFTDKMNFLFPLNLPIMFLIILIAAYLLRCSARVFAQTFKDGEYDWKAVVKAT